MKGYVGVTRWLLIYLLLGLLGCQAVVPIQAPMGAADASGATASPEIMQLIADKEYMARNTQRVDAILRLAPGVEGNIAGFSVRIESAVAPADLLATVSVSLHRGSEMASVALTQQGSSDVFDDRMLRWRTTSSSEGIALTVTIEASANPPQATEQWSVELTNLPTAGTSTTVGLTTGRVVGMEVDPLVYAQPATYSVTVSSPVTALLQGFGRRTVYPSADDGCAGIALTWQEQADAPAVTTTTETVLEDGNPICQANGTVAVAAITASHEYTYRLHGEAVGDGTFANETQATLLAEIAPVARVALTAGSVHSCALTAVGGVLCWGDNSVGQLGDGTVNDAPTPVAVVGLTSGVRAVTGGEGHSCAITTAGAVKCWGYNWWGRLGDGSGQMQPTPVNVVGLTSGVQAIDASSRGHTCALTNNGGLKCWGWNLFGQLGDRTQVDRPTPVDVVGLTSGVKAISVGDAFTCALTTAGGVKCWGVGTAGQLGDGTTGGEGHVTLTPVDVVGLTSGVKAISAGSDHACALTTAGAAKCWGRNDFGQLGNGTTGYELEPVNVVGLSSGVAAISAGLGHTCALNTTGDLFCWGWNNYGQIGDGTPGDSRLTPIAVAGLPAPIEAVAIGSHFTCAMSAGGDVFCWGSNQYAQLGDGTIGDYRATPGPVLLP